MNRALILGVVGYVTLLATVQARAQDYPKGSPEGAKLIYQTVIVGLDAGALRASQLPESGKKYFEVIDAAKWRAALAKKKDLLTPALRDTLAAGWSARDDAELPFLFTLLEIMGAEAKDRRALAFLGYFRAAQALDQRRPKQAVTHFAEAAQHFGELSDVDWEAACLIQVGLVHYRYEQRMPAVEAFTRALEMLEKKHGPNHRGVANCLHNLGAIHRTIPAEAGKAEKQLLRAVSILEKLDAYPLDLAAVCNSLGVHYQLQGNFAAALKQLRTGLKLREQALGPRHPEVAKNLDNVADCLLEMGDIPQALEHYQQARKIFLARHGERHLDSAINLHLIAKAQAEMGDYDESLVSHRQALEMIQVFFGRQHGQTAGVLSSLSHLYSRRGEYTKSLELAQEVLQIRLKLDGPMSRSVGVAHSRLGFAQARLQRFDRALTHYRNAVAIFKEVYGPTHPEVAANLNNLGFVHSMRDDKQQALAHYEAALKLYRDRYGDKHPTVAMVLGNLATDYGRSGATAKALELHDQTITAVKNLYGSRHPELARSYYNLGSQYYHHKQVPKALAALDEAVKALARRAGPKDAPNTIIDNDALEPLPITLNVLARRGQILQAGLPAKPSAEQWRDCARNYEAAARILERLRAQPLETAESKLIHGEDAVNWLPQLVGVYQKLDELEGDGKHLEAVFEVVERATARVFLESLAQSRAHQLGGVPRDVAAGETKWMTLLRLADSRLSHELGKTIDRRDEALVDRLVDEQQKASADYQDFQARLAKDYPRYASFKNQKPCSLAEARRLLARDEVALVYVLGAGSSYVLLMESAGAPGRGLSLVRLPPEEEILRKAETLTEPETALHPARVRALGAELHDMLLGPVSKSIAGKNLVIVPAGSLGLLPFEMLVEPNVKTGDDAYLVETHRIRYAPSFSVLHLVRAWSKTRTAPAQALLAVGDPIYSPGDERVGRGANVRAQDETSLPRLLHSGTEVAAVGKVFGASQDHIWTGSEAAEARLKKASAQGALAHVRYLHFATHGTLGRREGQQPSLVLNQVAPEPEDGFLRLDEITHLELNADLVVLSACQTGHGRMHQGEGVSGLARAFLYAGSKGVVCSLWSVDDRETANLMVDFYEHLKKGRSAPEALQQAQRAMIQSRKAPFHWAPFILIGE